MTESSWNIKRLLLVDDEEGIRNVLGIVLEDMGYEVSKAEKGEDALKIFHETGPAIILTDIKMPGMDGIELLCAVKKESPDTEVIMITGHGDIDLAIESLKYEATDFITKPINDEALEIALKRAEERITMRRQLREYTEGLERLVEEKSRKLIEAERLSAVGQTVAGLSHAIKNIAGGLQGGAYVLEQGIEQENREYLDQGWEIVSGNVEKIAKLSLDLLNYAKTGETNCRPHDPNAPAKEVIELMALRAKESGIELKTELAPDIPHFSFDPEGVHLCLMNLVTNAVDACEEDASGKQKEIFIRTLKTDGWGAEYQVGDNGGGMSPEVREKIFQSFFTTKGTRGTGIGLMMTKNIVDKHGGVLDVTTEKGKGTTFFIRLPPL